MLPITTSRRLAWTLLAVVTLLPSVVRAQESTSGSSSSPYSCWLFQETITQCTAIQNWQFDKNCDATANSASDVCIGDCFDCDPCHRHHYDCAACIAQGSCFWCPGDAYCSSAALTTAIWDRMAAVWGATTPMLPACSTQESWQSSTCESKDTSAVFTDPLYASMEWLYSMINVADVWRQGILGNGVHVRVNDVYGVDGTHDEFKGRFDKEHSCEQYLPPRLNATNNGGGTNGPFDYWTIGSLENHGTAVASLSVGGANNNVCAVGIAPNATLSACTFPNISNSFERYHLLKAHLDMIDITVNSWSDDACVQKQITARRRRELRTQTLQQLQRQQQQALLSLSPQQIHNEHDQEQHRKLQTCPFDANVPGSPCTRTDACNFAIAELGPTCESVIATYCILEFEADIQACTDYLDIYADCNYVTTLEFNDQLGLEEGIFNGRQGKGVIHVFAAGNLYAFGDNVDDQKWTNSRYTLTVAAVGKDGLHASYSNPGSGLWVTAPGGDRVHVTNNVVALMGGGCSDVTYGTSFAAPVVAGVVALMLEARSELGWRDVLGIFATTSRIVADDPLASSNDTFWTTNAAGFHHSYFYGFGLVDAGAAVELAKTWEVFPTEQVLWAKSLDDMNVTIPDDPTQDAQLTLTLPVETTEFFVENVVVSLQVDHPSRGDLVVTIASPSGTVSMLHEGPRPENTQLRPDEYWQLLTVRSWGESPAGEWKLSVSDHRSGNLNDNCVDIPWSYFLAAQEGAPYGASVTCSGIERAAAGQCLNGAVNDPNIESLVDPTTGLSPSKACCVCGGGGPPTQYHHVRSWRIDIYGHDLPGGVGLTTLFPPTDPPAPPPGTSINGGGNAPAAAGGGDQGQAGGAGSDASNIMLRRTPIALLLVVMLWLQ